MDRQRSPLYRSLDTARREFRLVRLLSVGHGDDDSNINFELRSFPLDTQPLVYKALSWRWWKDGQERTIVVGGRQHKVLPMLFDYLKLMKHEHHSEWIFIDALCINQTDIAERSSQVALMGSIYKGAQEVIAWLGNRINTWYFVDPKFREHMEVTYYRARNAGLNPFKQMSVEEQNWLAHILAKAYYWTRIWITQEILLARVLTLRAEVFAIVAKHLLELIIEEEGNHDYDPMIPVGLALNRPKIAKVLAANAKTNLRDDTDAYVAVRNLVLLLLGGRRDMLRNQRPLPLSTVVTLYAAQDCTETHDKIFGLIGLTRSILKIDYGMSTLELFIRVLVEGLIELEMFRPTKQRNFKNASEKPINYHGFWISLLSAMGLDPADSLLALAMEEINDLSSAASDEGFVTATIRSAFDYHFVNFTPLRHALMANRLVEQSKERRLMAKLRRLREKNSMIESPWAGSHRCTYSRWATWCRSTALDVLDQVTKQFRHELSKGLSAA